MKYIRIICLIAICILFSSCTLEPVAPLPTDYYYRLPEPMSSVQNRVFADDVLVRNFRSNGLHLERALVFSKDERGLVLEQHHYHFWQDVPPRMLQAQLVSWLRAVDAAPLIMTDPSISHQYVISARIKRFERLITEGTVKVIVALEMQLQHRGTDRLLLISDYAAEIEASDRMVQSSIPVYAEALDSIFKIFLEDADKALGQIDRPD